MDPLLVIQSEIDKLNTRSRKVELAYEEDRLSSAQYNHFTGLLAGLHSAKRLIIKAQKRGASVTPQWIRDRENIRSSY